MHMHYMLLHTHFSATRKLCGEHADTVLMQVFFLSGRTTGEGWRGGDKGGDERIPPSNEEALYLLLCLLRGGGLERLPNSERDLRTRQYPQYGPLGQNLCSSQSLRKYHLKPCHFCGGLFISVDLLKIACLSVFIILIYKYTYIYIYIYITMKRYSLCYTRVQTIEVQHSNI